MSYDHHICDPNNGGDGHVWKVTVSDWVPDPWTRTYETHVIQGCRPCGRLRALMWDARGKRLPNLYWWDKGRKPAEPNYVRFSADDHRDRLLKRVAELEAEQRKAHSKPPTKPSRQVQSATRKAA